MAKVALLIGVSEYEPGLTPLSAAVRDVEALQRVLQDPEMGGFNTVKTLTNPDPLTMQSEIEAFFTEQRSRDDLVLLYFSGHGIKDDNGNLYFATRLTRKNTKGDLIRATAVAARFVHEMLHDSRARRQVIILDCCFSGAFDPALRFKDDSSVDLLGQLGAEGRVVLASSSSTQYSLEEAESDLSLYTRYLIEGIETGAGDLNEDGQISAQELHYYASERVQTTAPNMTPKLITLKDLGFEIVLAKAKITDPRLRYRKTVAKYVDGVTIRPSGRAILDTLQQQLNLTSAEVTEIEAEVFRPYRERLANLQKYRTTLILEVKHQYPLDETARDALEALRQLLGLRVEDIAPIEQEIQAEFAQMVEQSLQENISQSATTGSTEKQELFGAEDFFNRGSRKHNSKDYQEAVLDFNEAIRLKPDYIEAYIKRGLAKSALDDKTGAILDFNEAICLEPDNFLPYLLRGTAKFELDDFRGAIVDLDEVIRLEPDSANLSNAYYLRGSSKYELDDKIQAVVDYNEAIRLQQDVAEFYSQRATVKYKLGDSKGAIEDYNEAIRLKPNFARFYYVRGIIKFELGDYGGTILDLDEAIRLELNPADLSHAYLTLGTARRELGDKIRAIVNFDAALQLQSDSPLAYYSRGLAKADLGDKEGAIIDYSEAIRLQPDFVHAYRMRGIAQSALGNNKAALSDFNEVVRLRPDLASAYYARSFVKAALGDEDGASKDRRKTVDLEPDNASVYTFRGRVLFNIGDKKRAIADFNEAIRLEADFADAYYHRGLAKSDLDDKQGAMIDYQHAAQLYQQQGDMTSYRNTLKAILQLEKKGKGFLGRLFS